VNQACAAHLDIAVVSSLVKSSTASPPDLVVPHTLQTAQATNPYRLVLVGITGFGNNSESLPKSVQYNMVDMKVAKSIPALNQVSAAIYYLEDAALPKSAGPYNLVIGSYGANSHVLTANVLELINVEQATGALDAVGGQANNQACSGHQPSDAVSVASAGGLVYSIAGVYGSATDASPNLLTGQTITEQKNDASLGTIAGYLTAVPAGSRTITWSLSSCSGSVHALMSIKAAKTP
jgi:hypothetical protein